MNQRPKALLLSGNNAEMELLRGILAKHVTVERAGNVPEMLDLLTDAAYDVVLCDWCFPAGTWRDALHAVQARYPELPTIVVGRTGAIEEGIQEWVWVAKVLAAGAFDLLITPCSEAMVLYVLEHALASREARAIETAA